MKNIRFALCFLFLCVLFAGCNKNTSAEMPETDETTVPEFRTSSSLKPGDHVMLDGEECVILGDGSLLILDDSIITVPTVSESEQVDPVAFFENATEHDISQGKDVEDAIKEMGFTEIHLYRNTDHSVLTMCSDGGVMQGTMKLKDAPAVWHYRAEKADSMIPRIKVENQLIAWDNGPIILDGENTEYVVYTINDKYYHLKIAYFPDTNNLYTFWTDPAKEWEYVGKSPLTILQHWEGDGLIPDYEAYK